MNNSSIKLGSAIKRIRRERKLSQQQLASLLGISTPYLNLIENNRRNITGKLLLTLATEFNIELSDIGAENDSVLLSNLMEAFSDELFESIELKNHDVQELVSSQPEIAKSIIRLYDVFKTEQIKTRTMEDLNGNGGSLGEIKNNISAEIISDLIQKNSNYFPILEESADKITSQLSKFNNFSLYVSLVEYLSSKHSIRVATIPPELKHDTIRYYDPVAKTLVVSDRLPQASKTFLVAQQMGLLFADDAINHILDKENIESEGEVRKLGRLALSNYFAGALILPYDNFLDHAKLTRYDIEVLENRFQASFEQVCHRLTTLQKPGSRAIPFHMMRVDIAGNISKRFSASGIAISRYSGACPRLNIYSAFTTPDRIKVQVSMMPDGSKFFCIARAFQKRSGGFDSPESFYSIGLGCSLDNAKDMIYADNILLDSSESIVPVGVSCRSCPRIDCRQRAFPPSNRQLIYDENVKGLSAYVTPN